MSLEKGYIWAEVFLELEGSIEFLRVIWGQCQIVGLVNLDKLFSSGLEKMNNNNKREQSEGLEP